MIFEQVDIWSLERVVFQDHAPQTQMCMCDSLEKEVGQGEEGEGVIRSGRSDQSWGPHTGDPHSWLSCIWTYPSRVGEMEYMQKLLHHANFISHVPLTVARTSVISEQLQVPISVRHFVSKRAQSQLLDPRVKGKKSAV